MAGSAKVVGRIGAMLGAVVLASGCTSIVTHRGYITDQLLISSVQPQIDNQQSVEKTLGRPSFTSQFGAPVWYYVSSNVHESPFKQPTIFQHSVIAVSFDQAGNVVNVRYSGIEQVARIHPESDKTPTLGRERSFLEDLFGNIGAVSAGAPGGGGGGGGGSGG